MIHISRIIQRLIRRVMNRERARNAPVQHRSPDPVKRLPATHQQAAESLKDFDAVKLASHRNKLIKANRDGTHDDILRFYRTFSKGLEMRGIPMYAFEFRRSNERQASLRAKGVSRAGPNESPHNFGLAVDIVHSFRFWDLTEKQWSVIGALGKEAARRCNVKIEWGGDWDFYDPAHWQLASWREYKRAHDELRAEGRTFDGPSWYQLATLEERVRKNRS